MSKCTRAKYCPECRKTVKKDYSAAYKQQKRKEEQEKKLREMSRIKVCDIAKQAKSLGMTYGEYVARMEGRL